MKAAYEHKPEMTFIGFSATIRPDEGKQHMGNDTAMPGGCSAGDMQSPDYECGIRVPVMERTV